MTVDYSAFPKTCSEWFDAVCVEDTGHVESVPPFLRPYVEPHLTPYGTISANCVFRTPLRLALWLMVGDMRVDYPWKGTGLGPWEAKRVWDEANAPPAPVVEAGSPEPIGFSDLYFIGADHGPIKIGVANDPAKRLKQLQTGYPFKLHILATVRGGGMQEIDYHQRFDAHRLEGEWFARHPDILEEIERLNGGKLP